MQYNIFIQNPTENHFMASVIGLPDCVAIGTTEAEALDKAKILLEEQLAKGKIVTVSLPSTNGNHVESSPLPKKGDLSSLPGCGIFKDDPTFDDFVERMAEFRARFNVEVTES
jgi:predicted RNase H-like HicB family nuclease